MQYLAFTIGPIFQTISKARKTRELWASSFVFSLLMKELLMQLPKEKIFLPAFDPLLADEKNHGAGIWPDKCILQIDENDLPDVSSYIDNALDAVASQLVGLNKKELEKLVYVFAFHVNWENTDLDSTAIDDDDKYPIHRINRLLSNLELKGSYQPIETKNLNRVLDHPDTIQNLYKKGFNLGTNKVFVNIPDGTIRLPSIPEISTVEIKNKYPDLYQKVITEPANEKIIVARSSDKKAKYLEGLGDDLFYKELKGFLPDKKELKFRNKYIAIVKADGDGVGKLISKKSIQNGKVSGIEEFSKNLMKFSKAAVKKIVKYEGVPVYAGGDDLLFLAPVTNGEKSVFDLCYELDLKFQKIFNNEGPTLSFGVSITYHKFPLGEAVISSGNLLKKAKKFAIYKKTEDVNKPEKISSKNSLCFNVQKHSGQSFGASLWMGKESFGFLVENILSADKKIDDSFLTSVMHKLEALPGLLSHACNQNTINAFMKHHFNEGGKHEKEYIQTALKAAQMIYEEYGNSLDKEQTIKLNREHRLSDRAIHAIDWKKSRILFSTLRLKQFLIQDDHD